MTRAAARDLIVVISSTQGWKYPLARMVTDTDGNVAVFTAPRGKPPVRQFTVPGSDGRVNAVKGTLKTTDGHEVTYRRRGASCSFALAKCNVKTPALVRLWPADSAPTPASAPADSKPSLADMRAWARENGFDVKDRGALPAKVVAAYKEAHA